MSAMNRPSSLRIGVLVPQGNTIHEREFSRLNTASVNFSFRGFGYPPLSSASFCDDLISQMEAPINELKRCGVQAILVGCTTASMQCASARNQARLGEMAGMPVITAASASRAAATALGLNAISVATPYGARGNHVVSNFLESQGISITAIKGLALDRSPEVWAANAPTLAPEQVLALALQVDSPQSQGLYLPCTGIGSLDAIAIFEARTGKPAFSSVQAGFWASLRVLGCEARQSGAGRLLETWSF